MKRKTAEEAYSIIFDNSITVCGQDLHLELKASSEHPGHSLKHADVSVLRMKAGKGWNTGMSPKKNNGYTPLVLLIPLSLKVSTIDDCRNFNVSHLLARTTITDIKKWRGDNLLPNPSIKRMNVVKNIA